MKQGDHIAYNGITMGCIYIKRSIISTITKDKKIRLLDPRQKTTA